jgi:hypothetical protein
LLFASQIAFQNKTTQLWLCWLLKKTNKHPCWDLLDIDRVILRRTAQIFILNLKQNPSQLLMKLKFRFNISQK